ncbi:hypothetical protein EIP91_001580 [Steccherinum ochraceum]|uniref:Uncharacterized protein n=1 Tax=Steccherinum ochraceum TaxID=92696 RepID=A0A4R0RM92_9APHY|nr:hypothetical protein EIP91_001580 [Steccherinum ochraceum]
MNHAGPSSEAGRRGHIKRRQRRAICIECRKRNTLCDGIWPCTTCISRGLVQACNFRSNGEKRKLDEGATDEEIKDAHSQLADILSSNVGTPTNDALYRYMRGLVDSALDSRKGKEILLSFRDEEAEVIMDWLQRFLREPHPLKRVWETPSDYRHTLRRLLVQLSRSAGILPSHLFLDGIVCLNRDTVAGGGFADIFMGSYEGQPVALKRLRVFKAEDDLEKSRKAFCAEALVWQHHQHKHILPFLGVDITTFAPFHCMVSPWMEKGNIMQCITSMHEKQINIPFNRWIRQIAEGLEYLHDQRIVHGDLRGANILINNYLNVQLCDFGLAMFADSTTASWGSAAGGAVRWLAPEVLKGSRSTYKSDIYAFGCVCLEVYTRKHPFADISSDAQVVARVLQGARPEKPEVCGRFQQGFWNLVKICWNEDPTDRPDAPFLVKSMEPRDDGLLMTDYDVIFPTNHKKAPSSPLATNLHSYDEFDEAAYLDKHSSFEPASFKPTSVLKSTFGSPFTDVNCSPSGSSFGVISLPASSINPSPEDSVPIQKLPSRKPSTSSPLARPSPMSSSPYTMISSSCSSSPIAVVTSQPRSFGPYEVHM